MKQDFDSLIHPSALEKIFPAYLERAFAEFSY